LKIHNGEASFCFDISRFRNIETGILHTFEDVSDINSIELENKFEYIELELEGSGSSSYYPGCSSSTMEHSYPEVCETNILSCKDLQGNCWLDKLSDHEKEMIEEVIFDKVIDQSEGNY